MADCTLSLALTSHLELSSTSEEHFVHNIEVRIEAEDQTSVSEVGFARVIQVRIGAAHSAEHSIAALFDATQDLTNHCFPVVDLETGDWTEAVYKTWDGDVFDQDLLIIPKLEILPNYRGHDIGLFCMARLIQMLSSGCGLVVIKPFPLQFDSSYKEYTERRELLGFDQLTASQADATEKLIKHYKRLGFRALPGTDLLCLSTSRISVSPEMIGLPEFHEFDLPIRE